jgi:hypothetical protein
LRHEAGGASRRPRALTVGVVVCVAAVVAAVVAFVVTRGNSRGQTRASSLPVTARGAAVGDVGDVTRPAALRVVLDRPSVTAAARTPSTVDAASLDVGAARALRCAATLHARRDEPVVLLATATYRDRAAVVAAVRRGTRTIAFVMDRRDCSVLVSQSR